MGVVDWVAGLRAGLRFVTTGPMLLARIEGQHPSHRFQRPDEEALEEYRQALQAYEQIGKRARD